MKKVGFVNLWKGLVNYGPQANSGLLCIKKVSWEHKPCHLVTGCSHTITAELSSCNRDHMVHKEYLQSVRLQKRSFVNPWPILRRVSSHPEWGMCVGEKPPLETPALVPIRTPGATCDMIWMNLLLICNFHQYSYIIHSANSLWVPTLSSSQRVFSSSFLYQAAAKLFFLFDHANHCPRIQETSTESKYPILESITLNYVFPSFSSTLDVLVIVLL